MQFKDIIFAKNIKFAAYLQFPYYPKVISYDEKLIWIGSM